MIPSFKKNGNLPPGLIKATFEEIRDRFGYTDHRKWLIEGLKIAFADLSNAGCKLVYIDGSFVTAKKEPGDYDMCWSIDSVDPDRLNPRNQTPNHSGEYFPLRLK